MPVFVRLCAIMYDQARKGAIGRFFANKQGFCSGLVRDWLLSGSQTCERRVNFGTNQIRTKPPVLRNLKFRSDMLSLKATE
jgi:hypothetical protein